MIDSKMLETQGEELQTYLTEKNKQDTLTRRIAGDIGSCMASFTELQSAIEGFHAAMAAKKQEVDERIAAEQAALEEAAKAEASKKEKATTTTKNIKFTRKISTKNRAINMLD